MVHNRKIRLDLLFIIFARSTEQEFDHRNNLHEV
jgi:hypothetical protein